jgi:hypothetical protein
MVGGAGIAAYVTPLMVPGDTGDRSHLFWYLPVLMLGLGFVALSGLLAWAALGAYRGHPIGRRCCRVALCALPVLALAVTLVLWSNEEQADRQRAERQERRALLAELAAERQRIDGFDVETRDEALTWRVTTSGGRPGTYRLHLRVENRLAVLYDHALPVELGEGMRVLRHDSGFATLFARCFDGRDAEGLYVCVPNAGTSNSRFRLVASLHPLSIAGADGLDLNSQREQFHSLTQLEAVMDTVAEPGQVHVKRISVSGP